MLTYTDMIRGFKGRYAYMRTDYYPAPLYYRGKFYRSAKEAYRVALELSPKKNKYLLREMFRIVKSKILINWYFTQALARTGSAELVNETDDPFDTFWGVHHGIGNNMLGKILIKVRRKLFV